MGITAFPPKNPTSWRVCRSWDGRRVRMQVYVPFGKNRKQSKKIAETIDKKLAERQRASRLRKEVTGEAWTYADGAIRGISLEKRKRNNCTQNAFRVQLWDGQSQRKISRSVSIDVYGFDTAFSKAIDFYAEFYGISRGSDAYHALMRAKHIYSGPKTRKSGPRKLVERKSNAQLVDSLVGEIDAFMEKYKRGAINGR